MKTTLKSIITCPERGYQKEEIMPTDTCRFFYECENCKIILKSKKAIVVFTVRTEPFPILQYKINKKVIIKK